jgi:hypothetical protein
VTLQLGGQAAVYWHLEAALRAIAAVCNGHCYDACTEESPCIACLVGHIVASALAGDNWERLLPSDHAATGESTADGSLHVGAEVGPDGRG